ncbi:MAG: hypothetical protein M1358_15395 [Chloroflexi bacterium]|nr:hypothetical protein [Chloroflexota bacterium]
MNEPRMFRVFRRFDTGGVSGPGRVMDGIVFHTGQVVVCWRTDIEGAGQGYSSICIYPSWQAFEHVHIAPHPENETEVRFAPCVGPPD